MPSPTDENIILERLEMLLNYATNKSINLAGAHIVGHTFDEYDFSNANMQGATFEGCTFECDLSEANMRGATFEGCTFDCGFMSRTDMRDCVFDKGCRFNEIDMTDVNLAGARFGDVYAQDIGLDDTNLAGVTFQTENGSMTARRIYVRSCNLERMDVSGLTLQNLEQLEYSDLSEVKGASRAKFSCADFYDVVVPERPDGLLKLDGYEHVVESSGIVVSEMINAPFVASATTNVDGKTKTLYMTLEEPELILTDHDGNDFLSAGDYEFVDASGRVVDIDYEQAVKGQFGLTRDAVVPTCGYQVDEYGEKKANLKLMSKSGEIVDVRMPVEQEDLDTMGKRGSDIRLYSSKDYVIEWQKDGFPAKSRTLEGHRIAALAEQAQMSKSTAKNLRPVRQDVRETPTEMGYER